MAWLCAIGVYVPDIKQAVSFYAEVLGFEVNKQYGPKIISLSHGQLPIVRQGNISASGIVRQYIRISGV
jgi:lactoylglutathione lyase